MTTPVFYIMAFLALTGYLTFIYGIFLACKVSLKSDGTVYEIPAFISNAVTSIAAILSTNLGAVLGITAVNEQSKFRLAASWSPIAVFTNPSTPTIQTIACYIYILALLACSIVWALRKFEPDDSKIVPLIPQMTKSLLGVIVGVIAILLNVQTSAK